MNRFQPGVALLLSLLWEVTVSVLQLLVQEPSKDESMSCCQLWFLEGLIVSNNCKDVILQRLCGDESLMLVAYVPSHACMALHQLNEECTEAKKHCWYFEGLYPTYYICRSYEDCCGSRCCVRALSIQRLWYFWFLLMMGVLFCCGAGFFIRRRMYPPPLVEEPTFNVSYTRQPVNTASGSQQPGVPYYTDPGGPVMNPMAMAFHVQPNSPQGNPVYPPPPSYCNTPPPPYEQVVKSST